MGLRHSGAAGADVRRRVACVRARPAASSRCRARAELSAQYVVCTLPASTLRDVVFEPALPSAQRDAISHLGYGPATRLLLQFETRFWKQRGRPVAFGSDLPIGAVWDGNEQQQ